MSVSHRYAIIYNNVYGEVYRLFWYKLFINNKIV